DLLARLSLELEQDDHGAVLLADAVEDLVERDARLAPLEQAQRIGFVDGEARQLVGGPPLAAQPSHPPARPAPAPPPVADDAQGDLVEPGRDLRLASPVGQAPLHDEEDLVNDVLDVDVRTAEAPRPGRDRVGVPAI